MKMVFRSSAFTRRSEKTPHFRREGGMWCLYWNWMQYGRDDVKSAVELWAKFLAGSPAADGQSRW